MPRPRDEGHPPQAKLFLLARQASRIGLALLVSWCGSSRAADQATCRQLRQQQQALATAAMEQEIALVRTIRSRLCPTLAAQAEVANARDGQYSPIDYGAWGRCRRQAERQLEASHSVRYQSNQGLAYYTQEGARLASQADEMLTAFKAQACQ